MIPLYRSDPYLTSCDTVVDRVLKSPEGLVVFCREALFMEGGGQPMDHGSLESDGLEFPLVKIVKEKGNTGYLISPEAELVKGQPVRCQLDWDRRFRTMRLHSAQHALAGSLRLVRPTILTGGMKIAEESDSCSVLYPTNSALTDKDLADALGIFKTHVTQDLAVRAESVGSEDEAIRIFGELYRPTVASGSLKGKIRLIVIDKLDANACGGTHVRSLAEVKGIRIVSVDEVAEGRTINFELSDGA